MSKVSCKVGFVETIESENHPGVWLPNIIERRYYGDMTRCVRRLETGESTNDNVNINNELSLISDPYAQSHIFAIRYVTWQGAKWKVTNVEVLYPRLVLTLGGIYTEYDGDESYDEDEV